MWRGYGGVRKNSDPLSHHATVAPPHSILTRIRIAFSEFVSLSTRSGYPLRAPDEIQGRIALKLAVINRRDDAILADAMMDAMTNAKAHARTYETPNANEFGCDSLANMAPSSRHRNSRCSAIIDIGFIVTSP